MMDPKDIVADQARFESERGNWDAQFQEVAELLLPRQAEFRNTRTTEGDDRNSEINDEHGVQALEQGVAVFEGSVMPRGARWQSIQMRDRELMKMRHVAAWCEQKTERLFELRNDPLSGFIPQTHECVASLLAFGNQAQTADLRYDHVTRMPMGLRYRSEHIGQVFIDETWQGTIGRTHRVFELTAEQALARWGDRLERADAVRTAAGDEKRKHNRYRFLHCVAPNMKFEAERDDWRGKTWYGCYVAIEDKASIDEGGTNAMPTTFSRFDKSPMEKYGRGPGLTVRPALKACQQLMVDIMTAAELDLMPPLAAHEDMMDKLINYGAREVTYGAIDMRGNPLVRPLFEVGDLTKAMAMLEQLHGVIDRAFYLDLLNIRQELKSHVTATEWMERNQEKGVLLAPLARQETEWFSVLLDREIELMDMLGEFDDMPSEVAEAGGAFQIVYDNPLNRAQKAEAASGWFRLQEQLAPLMPLMPELPKLLSQEFDMTAVVRGLAEINGVPSVWTASPEQRRAQQMQDQQASELANVAQLLPGIGKAARDLGQAEAFANAA